jgi:hypothetical protein
MKKKKIKKNQVTRIILFIIIFYHFSLFPIDIEHILCYQEERPFSEEQKKQLLQKKKEYNMKLFQSKGERW